MILKFLILLLITVFIETSVIQAVFRPGFASPDLVLILLITRAYIRGKETVLWAMLGGFLLDIMTDTLGHGLALETLAVYLFILISERILFRTWLAFVISAGVSLIVKKVLGVLIMGMKFSFDISLLKILAFWLIEICVISAVYILYLKRKE